MQGERYVTYRVVNASSFLGQLRGSIFSGHLFSHLCRYRPDERNKG